jgi:hypothetical protein
MCKIQNQPASYLSLTPAFPAAGGDFDLADLISVGGRQP